MKVAIIIPYFGKFPKWIEFFIQSLNYNPNIDWLFFSDLKKPQNAKDNVKFIHLTLEQFNELASQKLNLSINIDNGYKTCDFRPAYAIIFDEYLRDYDYWGSSDVDMIYGDIMKFIKEPLNIGYDIISGSGRPDDKMHPMFFLFKNSEKMNNLFKKSSTWQKSFMAKEYFHFDEYCGNNNYDKQTDCIGEVLKREIRNKNINPGFNLSCANDSRKEKIGIKFLNKLLVWYQGKLTTIDNKEEFIYMHYLRAKKVYPFFISKFQDKEKFFLSSGGICFSKIFCLFLMKVKYILSWIFKIDNLIGLIGTSMKQRRPKLYSFWQKIK